MSFDRDDATFLVLVNHEEQYSIWPDYKPVPGGWRAAGFSGNRQACLDHIERTWTDMRPLSLRRHMEEQAKEQAAADA
ncbi:MULTISPECIES: MbtH family protein [Cupriavidus]|uniref:MbtH family protein n=1 Tax=Cupriavidus TaxID=106589 RepID=UPI000368CFCF|nr:MULTISPECIES: MbtH family protein [Cupriavidus]